MQSKDIVTILIVGAVSLLVSGLVSWKLVERVGKDTRHDTTKVNIEADFNLNSDEKNGTIGIVEALEDKTYKNIDAEIGNDLSDFPENTEADEETEDE